MFIPSDVVNKFKPAVPVRLPTPRKTITKAVQPKQDVADAPCPIGCDSTRTSTLVSKPSRGSKGRLVPTYYRKTSLKFKEEQKRSQFEVFNNPALWS